MLCSLLDGMSLLKLSSQGLGIYVEEVEVEILWESEVLNNFREIASSYHKR